MNTMFAHRPLGFVLPAHIFVLVELGMLVWLELLARSKSQFIARKTCHSATGILMLLLDSTDHLARFATILIGMSSLLMTWGVTEALGIPAFSFGKKKDVGITIYLIIVMSWFWFSMPPAVLSPMFFADPAGALVGESIRSPKLVGMKSVAGSSAVFGTLMVTLLLFYPPMSLASMIFLSAAGTLAELFSGEFDNLMLAAAVIGGYFIIG